MAGKGILLFPAIILLFLCVYDRLKWKCTVTARNELLWILMCKRVE